MNDYPCSYCPKCYSLCFGFCAWCSGMLNSHTLDIKERVTLSSREKKKFLDLRLGGFFFPSNLF